MAPIVTITEHAKRMEQQQHIRQPADTRYEHNRAVWERLKASGALHAAKSQAQADHHFSSDVQSNRDLMAFLATSPPGAGPPATLPAPPSPQEQYLMSGALPDDDDSPQSLAPSPPTYDHSSYASSSDPPSPPAPVPAALRPKPIKIDCNDLTRFAHPNGPTTLINPAHTNPAYSETADAIKASLLDQFSHLTLSLLQNFAFEDTFSDADSDRVLLRSSLETLSLSRRDADALEGVRRMARALSAREKEVLFSRVGDVLGVRRRALLKGVLFFDLRKVGDEGGLASRGMGKEGVEMGRAQGRHLVYYGMRELQEGDEVAVPPVRVVESRTRRQRVGQQCQVQYGLRESRPKEDEVVSASVDQDAEMALPVLMSSRYEGRAELGRKPSLDSNPSLDSKAPWALRVRERERRAGDFEPKDLDMPSTPNEAHYVLSNPTVKKQGSASRARARNAERERLPLATRGPSLVSSRFDSAINSILLGKEGRVKRARGDSAESSLPTTDLPAQAPGNISPEANVPAPKQPGSVSRARAGINERIRQENLKEIPGSGTYKPRTLPFRRNTQERLESGVALGPLQELAKERLATRRQADSVHEARPSLVIKVSAEPAPPRARFAVIPSPLPTPSPTKASPSPLTALRDITTLPSTPRPESPTLPPHNPARLLQHRPPPPRVTPPHSQPTPPGPAVKRKGSISAALAALPPSQRQHRYYNIAPPDPVPEEHSDPDNDPNPTYPRLNPALSLTEELETRAALALAAASPTPLSRKESAPSTSSARSRFRLWGRPRLRGGGGGPSGSKDGGSGKSSPGSGKSATKAEGAKKAPLSTFSVFTGGAQRLEDDERPPRAV